jgi:hypothetical protein
MMKSKHSVSEAVIKAVLLITSNDALISLRP